MPIIHLQFPLYSLCVKTWVNCLLPCNHPYFQVKHLMFINNDVTKIYGTLYGIYTVNIDKLEHGAVQICEFDIFSFII